MKHKIHAVIFDLDGTLADSETIYRQSERWLCEDLGLPFLGESSDNFVGVSTTEYMQWFRREYRICTSAEQLCEMQTRLFLEYGVPQVEPFRPVVDFVKYLFREHWQEAQIPVPMGVASGSDKQIILALLQKFGIRAYFQNILSSSEVGSGKSKPAPDVFIECARQLGTAPQHCLVLEDSVPGVQAAQNADMPVIAIDSQEANDRVSNEIQEAKAQLAILQTANLFFENMQAFSIAQILQCFSIEAKP